MLKQPLSSLEQSIQSIVSERCPTACDVQLEFRPMRNSSGVGSAAHLRVIYRTTRGERRTASLVVKDVIGHNRREAAIYRALRTLSPEISTAQLFKIEDLRDGYRLYLQHVTPWRVWPWKDPASVVQVLNELARLHSVTPDSVMSHPFTDWNYEAELLDSAHLTVLVLDSLIQHDAFRSLRRVRPAVRQVVADLPAIRQELSRSGDGHRLLHGDVHTGNVVLRRAGRGVQAVLLDWGRARSGVPFEDVSAWLKSLGCWEFEVRRRHDSLLQQYLAARGLSTTLGSDVRAAYWLAAACNVLSGSLRYHAARVLGWGGPRPKEWRESAWAVHEYCRVLQRAAAYWRS